MKIWKADIFTDHFYDWMIRYDVEYVKSLYGNYYKITFDDNEKKDVYKELRKRRLRYRIYEKRWDRNSLYRKTFFEYNTPPYYCRYCGRPLKKYDIEVDHIVPVAKTKYSTRARNILAMQKIYNVNDVRNLAPACKRCNAKKSSKMGLWTIRGILGKYTLYWKILDFLKCIFMLAAIAVLFLFFYHNFYSF